MYSGADARTDGRWPVNVLLVSQEYPPETAYGGIGTYVYQLSHALVRAGHSATVLSKAVDRRNSHRNDEGVQLYRIPPAGGLSWMAKFRLSGLAHLLGRSLSVARDCRRLSRRHRRMWWKRRCGTPNQ